MNLPTIPPHLHIEKVGEKNGDPVFFVLDPDLPSWVFLNQDGLDILTQCDGKHTPQAIAEGISTQHQQLSPSEVLPVVTSFLEDMKTNKILFQQPAERNENRFRGIALEITQACNLRCRHCYLTAGQSAEDELSTSQLKTILREVKELEGISVAFGGGEPLMREDCVELLEYAASLDLLISLGTNGTMIDREMAKTLAALPLKLQISLDGATPETHDYIRGKGSFDKSVRGIDLLIEEGMAEDLLIAYTAMKPNVYEVLQIIDFALDRGIPVIQFPPLTSSGRATQHWEDLRLSKEERLWFWEFITNKSKELRGTMDLLADCFSMAIHRNGKPHQCTIGTQLRIDPVGKVYPCQCFHFGSQFCLGDLQAQPLEEIVYGQKIRRIKALSFKRPTMIEECKNCLWRNFCGGGCMGNAFERTGSALNSSSCEVRKQWIERLFEVELAGIGVDG